MGEDSVRTESLRADLLSAIELLKLGQADILIASPREDTFPRAYAEWLAEELGQVLGPGRAVIVKDARLSLEVSPGGDDESRGV